MIYGCAECSNNCMIPGKQRGTKMRDWVCPCGGALRKGRNADGASVYAKALRLEEQGVAEGRLGLKRSTSLPRTRGAVKLEVVVALVILGPALAAALVYGALWLSRRWLQSLPHAVRCDTCGTLLEEGIEPVVCGRCLACRYAVKQGLA